MAGGKGSYDRVVRTLERFRARGIEYGVECTFNARHVDAGISVVDLMNFFFEATGQRIAHIAPVMLPASAFDPAAQKVFRGKSLLAQLRDSDILGPKLVALYAEAARLSLHNIFAGAGAILSFVNNIVDQIASRRATGAYCPAFFDQLSIAADGSAYPCFMFIGDPTFRLGDFLRDEFPTPKSRTIFQRYFSEFGLSPSGTSKWYAPLLSGCIAGEFITTSSLGVRNMAAVYEAMIEECLLGIAVHEVGGGAVPPTTHARPC